MLSAGAPPALGALHEQTWETFATNWGVDAKGTFVWLRQALRQPMKRGGHIVVVSSGAAVQGSPVSGGYASAKRAQWFMADYAATESERAGLGLKVHCVLPALNPSTEARTGRHRRLRGASGRDPRGVCQAISSAAHSGDHGRRRRRATRGAREVRSARLSHRGHRAGCVVVSFEPCRTVTSVQAFT